MVLLRVAVLDRFYCIHILTLYFKVVCSLQVSRLVVSEIIRRDNVQERVACIEKWAAIADICRCMHNYNGVLQICAAFVNSSVYRLKKTWEKLTKQVNEVQVFLSYFEYPYRNIWSPAHTCKLVFRL